MKKLFIILALISILDANAQNIDRKVLLNDIELLSSDKYEGRKTGSRGNFMAAEYIINRFKENGLEAYNKDFKHPFTFKNRRNEEINGVNLIGYIKGRSDQVIVISAHYDHVGIKNGEIYNGADDDGSGTVALLEIAQAFAQAKKEGHGPKRSILFLHVTGEEHGLHGSRFYSENPLFPLANTVADVNIDMIGRRDEAHANSNNYVYIIGSDYLSSDLYTICEETNKKHIHLDLDYTYNDRKDPNRFYYRSDHYNFAKNGIPSVFLFNGTHADYHKATDEVEKIEFDALAKRTRYAFAIAWEIANRENRLIIDKDGK